MRSSFQLALFLAALTSVAALPTRSDQLHNKHQGKDVIAISHSGAASLFKEAASKTQPSEGQDEHDETDCVKEHVIWSDHHNQHHHHAHHNHHHKGPVHDHHHHHKGLKHAFCEQYCLPANSALSAVIKSKKGSCEEAGFPKFDHKANVGMFQKDGGELADAGEYDPPTPCNAYHVVKHTICEAFCVPDSDTEASDLSHMKKGPCNSADAGYSKFVGDGHISMYLHENHTHHFKVEATGEVGPDEDTTTEDDTTETADATPVSATTEDAATEDAATVETGGYNCKKFHKKEGDWCEEYCMTAAKEKKFGKLSGATEGTCESVDFAKFDHEMIVDIYEKKDPEESVDSPADGDAPSEGATCPPGHVWHIKREHQGEHEKHRKTSKDGLCESYCLPNKDSVKNTKEAHQLTGVHEGSCTDQGVTQFVGKIGIGMWTVAD